EVIDAVEHLRTVDQWLQPPARFAAATLGVIGKTDLLAAGEREDCISTITDRVRARNPTLPCVIARSGGIDPALLFDTIQPPAAQPTLPLQPASTHARHGHPDHDHAQTAAVSLSGPVGPGALMELLENPPVGAYRMKGRVRLAGSRAESGYLVNVVGRTIHIVPFPVPLGAGELVMIGPDLDVSAAKERLAALAGPSAQASQSDVDGLRRARQYVQLSTT
ncbi:MAG: GTP-binding protein, partial [Arachnia sp.]